MKAPERMYKQITLGIGVFSVAFVVDQLAKALTRDILAPDSPGLIYIVGTRNPGLAFSLPFEWWVWGLGLLLLAVLLSLYLRAVKTWTPALTLGLAFLLAGGIGNGVDRFLHGAVIDFIQIRGWTVFNLADIWVLTGLLLFVTHEVRARTAASVENGDH